MAGQYFGRVEQNLSHRKLGYILHYRLFLDRVKEVFYESPRRSPRMFFALQTEVEVLLSKGASVTMKPTFHPAESKKVKMRNILKV